MFVLKCVEKPKFSAMPQKWKPTILALALVVLITVAIVACIVINVYETATGNGSVA